MKRAFKLYASLWLVLVVTILVAKLVYDYAEQKLYTEVIKDYQLQTHQTINSLIQRQQQSSMTLAHSLVENPIVQQVLQPSAESHRFRKKLSSLVKNLNHEDGFKTLWVQLIDNSGNSVYRSWTRKKGDSLLGVRAEIKEMIRHPEPKQVISVGKFTMSFKSMMPVFDQHTQFVGMVEVITQFTPLAQELQLRQNIDSLLLTDKRFQKQLTKAVSKQFVDGYYVTNENVDAELLHGVRRVGAEALVQLQDYLLWNGYVVHRLPVMNSKGELLAHWLTFTPAEQINFESAAWVLQKYVVISVGTIILTLLLVAQAINNRHAERKKRYFRQIIDSVSDIIYISNYQKIIDSNNQFFDFFDQFDSLDSFLQKYHCVCDTFVEEPGLLHKNMDGEYWLDYVLNRPDRVHKAKIMRHGKAHIFQFKVKAMQGQSETLYNILMQDITEVELYKERLQEITVTDELTAVGNRLAYNNTIKTEVQRAHRYEKQLALLVIDIDFFKRVNDSYGHDVGDLVLIEVAKAIGQMLRESDTLCRYGGEEFVVILPETDGEMALQMAERVRLAIKELSSSDVPTQITISVGVTALTKWDSETTLMKRADSALYRAKDQGRDRVELANGTLPGADV